jgi:hypothetical protein
MFFQKNRRQIDRYTVLWDAVLEVRYPDYETRMGITVTNFSGKGALVYADRMFVNDRLLISAHHRPRLILKAFSPKGLFQAGVKICWYRWDVEENRFEIGLEYLEPSPENQFMASQILSFLHEEHRRVPAFHRRKETESPCPIPFPTAPNRSPA